jgi:microcystin degradation protein MlrC
VTAGFTGGGVRILLAMFAHETNTFSTMPTGRRDFERCDLRYGGEVIERFANTNTCVGGMIDAAAAHGVALVPSIAAAAVPAGRVARDVFDHVLARLTADLRAAGPIDALLLDLHGAMVTDAHDDGEGALLAAVREIVGATLPIAVTLDFHANVSPAMARLATLLIGYKTYPHIDMADRGREATERLADVLSGRLRPTVALRQPPLLPPVGRQGTRSGPMRRLYDRAAELERDSRVATLSIFAGFPLADVPDAGLSVYVVTHDDQARADAIADELTELAWKHRHEFIHTALPVDQAVQQALALDGGPVILADMADNTGGGAAGDGTELLHELLRVGARGATVACLWDPDAAATCTRAGVGATVTLTVGGKVDDRHGAPVQVTGRVRTLSDGRFVHKGPMMRGLEGRLGTTAVLDVQDVKIILISNRWQTLDPEMLRFVGIDPIGEKVIVVKSAIHYRAAFEPIAHAIVEVDAAGLSSSNLARFDFRRVRRPIFPLDAM